MAFQFSVVVFRLASLHKFCLALFLLLSTAEEAHAKKTFQSGIAVCNYLNVFYGGIGYA